MYQLLKLDYSPSAEFLLVVLFLVFFPNYFLHLCVCVCVCVNISRSKACLKMVGGIIIWMQTFIALVWMFHLKCHMVCLSVMLSCYRITCSWLCNKRFCHKKQGVICTAIYIYIYQERFLVVVLFFVYYPKYFLVIYILLPQLLPTTPGSCEVKQLPIVVFDKQLATRGHYYWESSKSGQRHPCKWDPQKTKTKKKTM